MKYLLILLIALSAQARIGETITQLDKRYGKAKILTTVHKYRVYSVNGIRINVIMLNDIAQYLSYSKEDGSSLTLDQCVDLIRLHAKGKKFIERKNPKYAYTGSTENKEINALIYKDLTAIIIMTGDYLKYLETARIEREKKEIEGL